MAAPRRAAPHRVRRSSATAEKHRCNPADAICGVVARRDARGGHDPMNLLPRP